jgi:hypothetical protein
MDLDPVILSRIQFAFVISFHIIFPSFTIGLAACLATIAGMRLATERVADLVIAGIRKPAQFADIPRTPNSAVEPWQSPSLSDGSRPIPDMSGGVGFLRKAIHRSGRADRRQLSSLSFQRSTDAIMPERLSSGPISTVNPSVPT